MNCLPCDQLLPNLNATLPTLSTIDRALAEANLIDFIQLAWPIVEPGTPFLPGKHIEAIALHLEAVTRGEIRNLLINIPPRCGKSLIVSVFWPTWTWIRQPETRWLFASYAQSLSVRDSLKCRRIIESSWYRENWGDRFEAMADQNTKARIENSATGYRLASSVDGALTGEGGDFLVCDDPHNVAELSDAHVSSTIRWWDEVMSTRINDPRTGRKVIVMQRVSESDLSGHVLAKGDYVHLCMPMEFEPERKCSTALGWEDWRTEEGELLWPDRIDTAALERMKKALGSYGVAGQLQQRPAPRGGGIFKREWFEIVAAAPAAGGRIRYWDRAASTPKPGRSPDWTVGLRLAKDSRGAFYVEDVARFQCSPRGVEDRIMNTAGQDGIGVAIGIEQDPGSAGVMEADYYVRQLAGHTVMKRAATKDKVTRATPVSSQAEAGNIKIVRGPWNEAFLDELCQFPNAAHDDQVDALSGAFAILAASRKILVA